jgi:hypothetical protein
MKLLTIICIGVGAFSLLLAIIFALIYMKIRNKHNPI